MNRYKNINTKRNDTDKLVYQSVIYPKISKTIEDDYIMTVAGDRLDLLAYKYYGDSSYWFVIASTNELGKGSMVLPAGLQLRILKDPEIFISKII